MCDFPSTGTEIVAEHLIADESVFLIGTLDPWYGDIIIYLQTQTFWPELLQSQRRTIHFQSQQYHIVGDTLYRHGANSVFRRYIILDEAENVLNDSHSRACVGHMSGYATAQKILHVGYFLPSLFKYSILVV